MADQISILSVNGYMQKYAVDGIGKGADKWQVKRDMLDEFRREIFNMAVFRVGADVLSGDADVSDKDRQKLDNIYKEVNKKWKAVCREFSKYKETCGLLEEDDLQKYLEERLDIPNEESKAVEDLKEDVTHNATQENSKEEM